MPSKTDRPRVALFVTCMVDTLYPHVGEAAQRLLEHFGASVMVPEAQTCCGQPAFNAGYRDEARMMARHFLEVFWPAVEGGDVEAIVAPSGSCVAMVRGFYDILFSDNEDELDAAERARALQPVTYELTQYLADVLGVAQTSARFSGKLTYHPCCHLLRELQVDEQPRRLLFGSKKLKLVTLPGADECCGFGGLFAVKNAELSTAMGRRKVANIETSGADAVVMNDVSCMTHINGLLERGGHPCRAIHIAELLNTGQGNDRSKASLDDG